jgi:hypothetical protein
MKHFKRFFLIFLMCFSFLQSQQAKAQLSTIGKEFYFGFMENNFKVTQVDKAVISITASENSIGTIQYLDKSINFNLAKGKVFTHEIPTSASEDIIHRSSGTIQNKGVQITSSGNITVHAFNIRSTSSDGTIILPVPALGKEYLVTTHYIDMSLSANNFESTILVVSSEDDTDVEIIPKANTSNGNTAGTPITFKLNKGQSYQLKGLGDLTGSSVRVINSDSLDCKRIAVFGGNKMTQSGSCGSTSDHLFQQTYPLFTWGNSFIHVPLLGRDSGELVKVLASEDGTQITVNGQIRGDLNKGEFLIFDFNSDDIVTIAANFPIAATMISKSQDCDSQSVTKFGDPFLITYNPSNERIKEVLFNSLGSYGFLFHYVNVIVPATSVDQTVLNGNSIGSSFKPVSSSPDFFYAQIQISAGPNSLFNPEGMIAYAYGAGNLNSYGFSAGASFESIKFESDATYDFEVIGEKVACFGVEGTWSIVPKNDIYEIFEWDFGDGSAPELGQEVGHTFQKEGAFKVSIKASSANSSCAVQRTFSYEVVVKKIEMELLGEFQICAGSTQTYEIGATANFKEVVWGEISGGELVSSDSTLITIEWGDLASSSGFSATPIALNGCVGPLLNFEVNGSGGQTLAKAEGDFQLCGPEFSPLFYSVPNPDPTKTYLWDLQGGKFLSSAEGTEVNIQWDNSEEEKWVSYEIKATDGSTCNGISEKLSVSVSNPIILAEVITSLPTCPGEFDGSLELKITGGSGEFDFMWEGYSTEKSRSLNNIGAEEYSVLVTDRSGCGLATFKVTLQNPEPMKLTNEVEIFTATCSDSGDGGFRVKVAGGASPYKVEGIESIWDGEYLKVYGLSPGEFKLFIADSKGCTIPVSGIITGGIPLQVKFVEESQSCPGGNFGRLGVQVTGGQPPYRYVWNIDGGVASESNVKIFDLGKNFISNVPSGQYRVTVIDQNGCELTAYGEISELVPQVRMPTGYLPTSGLYSPVSNCTITFAMQIFDRWGQTIYKGTEGWNGKIREMEAPIGTYTYTIGYTYSKEGNIASEEKSGIFTLIR